MAEAFLCFHLGVILVAEISHHVVTIGRFSEKRQLLPMKETSDIDLWLVLDITAVRELGPMGL